MPSRTIARNLTTASSGVSVSASGAGVNSASSSLEPFSMKPGSRWKPVRVSAAKSAAGRSSLMIRRISRTASDAQRPGGHQPVVLQVPHHGAVGADDRAGVAELFFERVQPARRAAGDKNEFDAGLPAGVEGPDGAVADLSVVPKNRSINVTCYQPHPASLRGAAAAGRRRTLLLEDVPRRFLTLDYVLLSVRDVRVNARVLTRCGAGGPSVISSPVPAPTKESP